MVIRSTVREAASVTAISSPAVTAMAKPISTRCSVVQVSCSRNAGVSRKDRTTSGGAGR